MLSPWCLINFNFSISLCVQCVVHACSGAQAMNSWEPEYLLWLSTLFFETGSPTESAAHGLSRLADQAQGSSLEGVSAPCLPHFSPRPHNGITGEDHTAAFYRMLEIGTWGFMLTQQA